MKKTFLTFVLAWASFVVMGSTPQIKSSPDKADVLYIQSITVSSSHYLDYKDTDVYTNTGSFVYYYDHQNWYVHSHTLTDGVGGTSYDWDTWQDDDWEWSDPLAPTNRNTQTTTTGITWTDGSEPFIDGGIFYKTGVRISTVITNGVQKEVATDTNYWSPFYVYNEHCVVPDFEVRGPTAVVSGGGYTDTQTSFDEYARTAQTTWHLNTGGKAGRKDLWRLSATAGEVRPAVIVLTIKGNPTGLSSFRDITPSQISIRRRALGADGNLWMVLPEGTTGLDVTPVVKDVDFYTFNVNTQKYKLRIVVNGTTPLQDDRIVNGAYYCVDKN